MALTLAISYICPAPCQMCVFTPVGRTRTGMPIVGLAIASFRIPSPMLTVSLTRSSWAS